MAPPDDDDSTLPGAAADAMAATVAPAGTTPAPGTGSGRRPPYERLVAVDVDHYNLEGELAKGGMGKIMVARDRRLDRPVAIKVMHGANPGLEARFEREARITARLQHPAIVPLYEAGRFPGGEPFYAMKLVSGKPFDAALADAKSLPERLKLLPHLIAVVEALAYAHDRRIVHRDLKPQNVLVGRFGETVVIDWGLAKDLSLAEPDDAGEGPYRVPAPGSEMTVHGEVIGTPAYMPPEQARGEPADERADVYALGAFLYCLISGRPPFQGESSWDVIAKVKDETPVPIGTRVPEVPPDLAAIVDKAMARRPEDRYPRADALAADLRRFQEGGIVGVHRYTAWQRVRRFVLRHRAAVAISAVAVLALAGLGVASFIGIDQKRREAVSERERADRERELAEKNAKETQAQRVALLVAQGQKELLAGYPHRAATYLREAYPMVPGSGVVRALLADAMRPFDALEQSYAAEFVLGVGFTQDGGHVWGRSRNGTASLYEVGGKHLFTLGEPQQASSQQVAVSPDGALVVFGSPDGSVLAVSDKPEIRLGGPGPQVHAAAFDESGTLLAVVDDEKLRVWRRADLALLFQSPLPRAGEVLDIAYVRKPAGGLLLAIAQGNDVLLWDLDARRLVRRLADAGNGDTVKWISLDREQQKLFAVAREGAAVWNPHDGKRLATLPHLGEMQSGAISADGRYALLGVRYEILVWDLLESRLRTVLRGHTSFIWSLTTSRDGERILSGSDDGTARLWSRQGALLAVFGEHADSVSTAIFSADERHVLTGSADGTMKLWRARPGRLVDGGTPGETRFIGNDGGKVVVWDASSGQPVAWLPEGGDNLTLRRDGKRATVSQGNLTHLWDPDSGKILASVTRGPEERVRAALFEAKLLVLVCGTGRVIFLDSESGATLGELDATAEKIWTAALTRDARWLLLGGEKGSLRIAELDAAGKPGARRSLVVDGFVSHLAISDDGRRAVTYGNDLKVWDVEKGEVIRSLTVEGRIGDVDLSPDGTRVLLVVDKGNVQVIDVASGKALFPLEGHTSYVYHASFLPRGGFLTGGEDGTARVWDGSGELMIVLPVGESVRTVWSNADETRVMTDPYRGRLEIWDITVETRSPAEIGAATQSLRWQLSRGRLARR